MELIFLGSGCCIPSLTKNAPGILIIVNGESLLFDSGSGILSRILKAGIDYKQIKHIFYTHFHSDHTADLIPFIQALRFTPNFKKKDELNIYGPKRFNNFINQLANIFGEWVIDHDFPFQIHELEKDNRQFTNFTITTMPMQHSKHAIGYRIKDEFGKSIVYSGDTDFCEEIIELANNADILILECSFPDSKKVKGHLTPSEAAKIASLSNCKHLILNHFYPPYNILINEINKKCSSIFKGKISIAEDSMKIFI